MTAPLSQDFNAFLYAPIGEDANGMPLTLLSALARLGVDPWDEAASLATLSQDSATQRLASLLGEPSTEAEPHADATATVTVARRLIALLHRSPRAKVSSPQAPPDNGLLARSKRINPAIYYLAAVLFLFVCQWAFAG
ncbi:MAG TPA: hypothetical protein VGO61_03545 [Steroidobacteraceae bacterium]|jgi:hypothetical protein|nr:hypothetical protein [Steroidobacteraceae bacterium]